MIFIKKLYDLLEHCIVAVFVVVRWADIKATFHHTAWFNAADPDNIATITNIMLDFRVDVWTRIFRNDFAADVKRGEICCTR
jgi:hypothetical protein